MAKTPSSNMPVDAVPELYHYEDTGCDEVSATCLHCPLPQCRYDDPLWYQRNRRLAKDMRVVSTMYQENLTVEETAARFSVTVRTIFRIIRRCRDAGMPDFMGQQDLMAFAAD